MDRSCGNAFLSPLRPRPVIWNAPAPYFIADYYADLGDKEHAFEWLNIAYQEHKTFLIFLRTEPGFDFLHSGPRYADLVRKIGLPQ